MPNRVRGVCPAGPSPTMSDVVDHECPPDPNCGQLRLYPQESCGTAKTGFPTRSSVPERDPPRGRGQWARQDSGLLALRVSVIASPPWAPPKAVEPEHTNVTVGDIREDDEYTGYRVHPPSLGGVRTEACAGGRLHPGQW